MSIGQVWRGIGSKNNPQPRTPDWSATGGGDGDSSEKTLKSREKVGDKRHPQPNTLKHPNVTKDELMWPSCIHTVVG